jgi:broad specificity phosphatase PhoE
VLTFFRDFVRNPAPAGMEQLSSVVARASDFLDEVRGLDGNLPVSTHAIAMKGLLEYLTPGSNGAYWSSSVRSVAGVWCLYFVSDYAVTSYDNRVIGFSVRAVRCKD